MDAWSTGSLIMTPPIFIVLLLVLWKILRAVNGLYTVMVYVNDQINAMSDLIEKLAANAGLVDSKGEGGPAPEAPPAPSAAPAGDAEDRQLFVVAPADPEQSKRKILSLLRQRPGLRYSDLAEALQTTVDDVKALCSALEKEGKLAGKR